MKNEESPEIWIAYAESDFAMASIGRANKKIKYENLCFHSQQAAEKAIKAILVFKGKKFPKSHSIKLLLDIIESSGENVPSVIKESDQLTDYAIESRYPGLHDTIDNKEYKESLKLAAKVLEWSKSIIKKSPDKLF
jgi:HEPN domain-containing protein